MSLRLALLEHWVPAPLKASLLDELSLVTAEGFGCVRPAWSGRGFETRLHDYARFTAACAEGVLAGDDAAAAGVVKERLRAGATQLGTKLRRQLGVRRGDDAPRALAMLYHHLGIEMTFDPAGELVVTRCLFSASFSEPVCGLVSGLDEGMAAGLSGGGHLEFVERITGGSPCCRARFVWAGRP